MYCKYRVAQKKHAPLPWFRGLTNVAWLLAPLVQATHSPPLVPRAVGRRHNVRVGDQAPAALVHPPPPLPEPGAHHPGPGRGVGGDAVDKLGTLQTDLVVEAALLCKQS